MDMVKQFLGIFLLITIGVVAGLVLSSQRESTIPSQSSAPTAAPLSGEVSSKLDQERVTALEAEIARLQARVATLESVTLESGTLESERMPDEPVSFSPDIVTLTPDILTNPTIPVAEGLIAAGIDVFTAEDIARKQSETQLKRLELRDTAFREDFMGSDRYREELAKIRQSEVRIRDEIDDESYDKYLFYTGQSNRIAVSSVMLGSAAEQSGIHAGDLIVRYENEPLYNYRDLREATIQGERGEIIDLTVVRDGSLITVSIPRGPLGVRLNSVRMNPDNS
jgi:membrane-associated protease RseP (regulator of RpoE activity)